MSHMNVNVRLLACSCLLCCALAGLCVAPFISLSSLLCTAAPCLARTTSSSRYLPFNCSNRPFMLCASCTRFRVAALLRLVHCSLSSAVDNYVCSVRRAMHSYNSHHSQLQHSSSRIRPLLSSSPTCHIAFVR